MTIYTRQTSLAATTYTVTNDLLAYLQTMLFAEDALDVAGAWLLGNGSLTLVVSA